jgi:16S rRNA (guanine966-N2)-methyltransferase
MRSVRIIAGKYGSLSIDTPGSKKTHPMGDRVKGALFNSLSDLTKDAIVLDAFAGSGALGLEALSRGAKKVVFVDNDERATDTIKSNVVKLGCQEQARIVRSGVASWADETDEKFDIIIADPPYDNVQFSTVRHLFKLLHPKGLMVLSYPGRGEVPTETGVVVVDNRSYGEAALAFYRLDR